MYHGRFGLPVTKVEIKVGDYVMLNEGKHSPPDSICFVFKNKVLVVTLDYGALVAPRYICRHGTSREFFYESELRKVV